VHRQDDTARNSSRRQGARSKRFVMPIGITCGSDAGNGLLVASSPPEQDSAAESRERRAAVGGEVVAVRCIRNDEPRFRVLRVEPLLIELKGRGAGPGRD